MNRHDYYALMVFILLLVILLTGNQHNPVYILDEARNAQCAKEMLQTKSFIVPTFNGELRPHKPPLHYYGMMLCYSLFKATPFAARLMSALMCLLLFVQTYLFVKRHSNAVNALAAIICMLCSFHLLFEYKLAVPDPYLITFFSLGCFYLYDCFVLKRWKDVIYAGLCFGLALLSKGPVAIGIGGLAAIIYLLIQKQWRRIFSMQFIAVWIIAIAIALPWFIAVHQLTQGAYTRGFFLEHNLQRFNTAMEDHGGPFVLTLLYIIVGMLPATILLFLIPKKIITIVRANSFLLFSFCMLMTVTLFFCISTTKLPNYPMLCYPFLAIILSHASIQHVYDKPLLKRFIIIAIIIYSLLGIGAFIALRLEKQFSTDAPVGFVLLLCIPAFIFLYRQKEIAFVATLSLTFFIALDFIYPYLYRKNPIQQNLALIQKAPVIYAYKFYNPALNFYYDKPVTVIQSIDTMIQLQKHDSDALFISRQSEIKDLPGIELLSSYKDPFEMPVTVFFRMKQKPF